MGVSADRGGFNQAAPVANVVYVQQQVQIAPNDYCGMSCFAFWCCFWPLAICSLIESSNVQSSMARNDIESAQRHSINAHRYNKWSIGIGIVLWIIIIIIIASGGMAGHSGHYYNNNQG